MISNKNRLSYLFLAALALICVVLVSVRYGVKVQKINGANEYILAVQRHLSLTPSPKPYAIPQLSKVSDAECGIGYIIPTVATESAQITCIDPQSTLSAELVTSGYKRVLSAPTYLHVYLKSDEDIMRLISESLVAQ
ncbi:MAG: hypothetical protein WCJ70_02815 [bacterium]